MQCHFDLASSDSHLLGRHKKHIPGKEIATDADVEQPVAGGLLMFNTDFFYAAIQGFGLGGEVKCLNVSDGYMEF